MAPLPLFKLGALLAKQISKPLAKYIKLKAVNNEFIKNYIVLPTGHAYHRADITVRMRLLGLGSPDKVPPLSEKQAIEQGAEMLSDLFVFGTAVAAIMLEYLRQSHNKATKDTEISNNIQSLNTRNEQVLVDIEQNLKLMKDLKRGIDDQKDELKKLSSRVNELEAKSRARGSISTQTSSEKPIGRIMYPSNSDIKPNADVRNSIIYQSADDAIISLIQKSID